MREAVTNLGKARKGESSEVVNNHQIRVLKQSKYLNYKYNSFFTSLDYCFPFMAFSFFHISSYDNCFVFL